MLAVIAFSAVTCYTVTEKLQCALGSCNHVIM